MSVNLERGAWFCHACAIGGGLLDFERRLTGKPDAECWAAINATIGRDAPKASRSTRGQIVATYDYHDAAGKVVFQAVRYESKGFSQQQPDGRGGWIHKMDGVIRVPFNLPALVRANVGLVAEGEKDALNLQKAVAGFPDNDGKLSYAATTNIGGAGKWLDSYSPYLAGKKVFVFQDNDDAGREHALEVCASVHKFAQAVHLVELSGLAHKGDVSDYLQAHTPAELFAVMQAAPVWTPPTSKPAATGQADAFDLVPIGDLLSRPEVPPDYLVDGLLIRGTVSVAVSKPKVGKSTFARNLCLAVAQGRPFLGRSTRQGSCIYLALEERHEEITADFRAMGAEATDPVLVHAAPAPLLAIVALADLIRRQRPALVVGDPLFRLASIRDEKAYAEVYAALGPLIDLARETDTHILLTHHSGKSPKVDPIDSPLGSTAIGGAAATAIVLCRRESYRTLQTVTRIGPTIPETVLTFDPETRLLSIGGTRAEADCNALEEEIIEYLRSAGEKIEPEIAEQVEGRNAVKRKALRSLVEKGMVTRAGTGKRNDAFRYSYPCTHPIAGTRVQETENGPQTRANIEEKLVPGNRRNPLLVPEKKSAENDGLFEAVEGPEGAPKPEGVWL